MGLAIACYTNVKAGMKVATPASSEHVAAARRAVMEFTLVNHPLDCPICDKAGECLLQENFMLSTDKESRLRPEAGKSFHGNPAHAWTDEHGQRRGGKRVDLGPRVVLDEERCVACDRCVRFMRHIAGSEQLQLAARGDHTHIATFPGERLDHPYDRCVTDICPVGALTDKAFRFKKRVWMLKRVPSVSMDDSLGANIWLDHEGGILWRVMPRCNASVNRSWLANQAREVADKVHQNRLLASGKLPALQGVAGKIAVVAGGSCTNEDLEAIQNWAKNFSVDLYGGSFLPVGTADGIARSGDPVANRKGLQDAGFETDLSKLAAQADAYSTLLTVCADLWDETPDAAQALEAIGTHIALSPFDGATAKHAKSGSGVASGMAFGVRHWTEVWGHATNCNGLVQELQGAPTRESSQVQAVSEFFSL
jgi:NADH-quinone oxidoreductase subunit G